MDRYLDATDWTEAGITYEQRSNDLVVTTCPDVDSDEEFDCQTERIKKTLQRVLGGTWEAGNQETCEDGDTICGWHRV